MNGRPAAVTALAQGLTTAQAAEAAGVTTRTVQRWVHDPDFGAEVRDTRKQLLQNAAGMLATGAIRAAETLFRALDDPDTRNQIQAARVIFDTLLPLRASVEFEERMAEIEARLGERQ
ncbi:helix-turn-helix domain-containing protein [Streptomyces coelicoflavus]|uniref:helix-turn-helix domain-containing protein n=1 Tax=Streptomyces coelicoflavus TaxID=285562 RepID=UPI000D591DDB|nr:helix-turn-helix domain-containing protein [Streptomyces coelicoflavus]